MEEVTAAAFGSAKAFLRTISILFLHDVSHLISYDGWLVGILVVEHQLGIFFDIMNGKEGNFIEVLIRMICRRCKYSAVWLAGMVHETHWTTEIFPVTNIPFEPFWIGPVGNSIEIFAVQISASDPTLDFVKFSRGHKILKFRRTDPSGVEMVKIKEVIGTSCAHTPPVSFFAGDYFSAVRINELTPQQWYRAPQALKPLTSIQGNQSQNLLTPSSVSGFEYLKWNLPSMLNHSVFAIRPATTEFITFMNMIPSCQKVLG